MYRGLERPEAVAGIPPRSEVVMVMREVGNGWQGLFGVWNGWEGMCVERW